MPNTTCPALLVLEHDHTILKDLSQNLLPDYTLEICQDLKGISKRMQQNGFDALIFDLPAEVAEVDAFLSRFKKTNPLLEKPWPLALMLLSF